MDAQLASRSKDHPHLWFVYVAGGGVHAPEHEAYPQAHGFQRLSGDPNAFMGVIEYSTPASANP